MDDKEHWCGLKSVIQIISTRFDKKSKKETVATRYYISSLEKNEAKLAKIIRSHWAIENNLHWRLDVTFNEDKQMKRKNNSAFNFNIISKIAMTLIDKERTNKLSLKKKRLKAAWNDDYRESILRI